MNGSAQIPSDDIAPVSAPASSSSGKKIPLLSYLLGILIVLLLVLVLYLVYTQMQMKQKLEDLNSQLESQSHQNTQLTTEKEDLSLQLDRINNPPYFTNYLPVKYFFTGYQKAAQVFTLDSPKNVSGIRLQASYGVGIATVALYEVDSDPDILDASPPLVQKQFSGQMVIKEKPFDVIFPNPVVLESDKKYALIISVNDKNSEINVGFAEADTQKNGMMYIFSRLIGGNGEILDPKFSWQPRNLRDLIYELIDLTSD